MAYEFSPHVAVQVRDYADAVAFYETVMGMEVLSQTPQEADLRLGPMTFHIENNPTGLVFFEFKVTDVDAERERLVRHGCRITRIYSEKSVMMADPYGMQFHLYAD